MARSRTLISPFWTKTGRNAPKDDEEKKNRGELRVRFMFGLPASLRSFNKIGLREKYLRILIMPQQEFFIAASYLNFSSKKEFSKYFWIFWSQYKN